MRAGQSGKALSSFLSLENVIYGLPGGCARRTDDFGGRDSGAGAAGDFDSESESGENSRGERGAAGGRSPTTPVAGLYCWPASTFFTGVPSPIAMNIPPFITLNSPEAFSL